MLHDVITFPNYDCSTDELLRMLNWVNLDRQRIVDNSTMMYKIVKRMVPDYLSSHLVFRSYTLTYNLRESDFLLAIFIIAKDICTYYEAVLWNGLPLDILQALSLDVSTEYKLKNDDFGGFAFIHTYPFKAGIFYNFSYCISC